jgi:hypothetical protein
MALDGDCRRSAPGRGPFGKLVFLWSSLVLAACPQGGGASLKDGGAETGATVMDARSAAGGGGGGVTADGAAGAAGATTDAASGAARDGREASPEAGSARPDVRDTAAPPAPSDADPNSTLPPDGRASEDEVAAGLFALGFAEAFCRKKFECCRDAAGSPGGCEVEVELALMGLASATFDSAKQGRAGFRPDQATKCLDRVRALDCASARARFWTDPICDGVFESKVPVGGACTSAEPDDETDYECIAGFCAPTTSIGGGVCAASRALGAKCGRDSECTSEVCAGGTCAAAPADAASVCREF